MSAQIVGKYDHLKNENLDEYFSAAGVPYIPRKLMCMSSPSLEFRLNGDEWTMINSSAMRTTELKFKLGVEFEETMPNGQILKNMPSVEDNKLQMMSEIVGTGVKTSRVFIFDDQGCVVTYTHGEIAGKRHFKRATQ